MSVTEYDEVAYIVKVGGHASEAHVNHDQTEVTLPVVAGPFPNRGAAAEEATGDDVAVVDVQEPGAFDQD